GRTLRCRCGRGRECIVNRRDPDGARSILPLPASPGKMDSDPEHVPAGVQRPVARRASPGERTPREPPRVFFAATHGRWGYPQAETAAPSCWQRTLQHGKPRHGCGGSWGIPQTVPLARYSGTVTLGTEPTTP